MPVPDQAKGLGIISAAAFSGSAFGLLMRWLEHYGAFGVIALRGSVQVVAFSCYLLATRRNRCLIDAMSLDRLGGLAALAMAGQSLGISVAMLMTTVSNVFFCINIAPAICIVSDVVFLKERVARRTQVMVISCLIGVSIILGGSYQSGGSFVGCLIALVNPLSWTAYWGIQRHRSKESLEKVKTQLPVILLWAQLLLSILGYIVSLATGSIADGYDNAHKRDAIIGDVVLFAFFGGIMLPCVQYLFSLAPRYISTAQVACIKITEVFWGSMWIFVFKGEVPECYTLLGGSFIFCAIFGHSLALVWSGAAPKTDSKPQPNIDEPDETVHDDNLAAGGYGIDDQESLDHKAAVVAI